MAVVVIGASLGVSAHERALPSECDSSPLAQEIGPDRLPKRGRIASMAKRTTILKRSGLRRAFGPNTIFEKFSLEVRTGEAVALTGRNGAGKSTLLRCLVGADRPDDGRGQG